VGAEEAYRLGLLDRIVAADSLVEEAVKYAEEMTQWPPLALRSAKRVLQHNFEAGLDEGLRYESVGLGFARKAPNDAKESFLAFSEKRKGVFTGT
jgi:enoyl-CoA hydratase/carnithine racemase